MESVLRGSFVSLASKGYPNRCHTPIGIAKDATLTPALGRVSLRRSTRGRSTGLVLTDDFCVDLSHRTWLGDYSGHLLSPVEVSRRPRGGLQAGSAGWWLAAQDDSEVGCKDGLSRMKGNFHVRFLGEGASAMTLSYPTLLGLRA